MVIKKSKLIGLFILAIGIASIATSALSGSSAHALNGSFKWVNTTTIEADDYGPNGAINFTGSPPTYTGTQDITLSNGGGKYNSPCSFTAKITVNTSDYSKGTIKATSDNLPSPNCDLSNYSGDMTIANVGSAPKPTDNIDYANVNCADGSKNGGDQAKCNSIKACIKTAGKTKSDCVYAYTTCVNNHATNGATSDADKKACQDQVAAGNLTQAVTPPANTSKSSCSIAGIGWIVCPVINFMAQIVDASYNFVSSLLFVQPLVTTTDAGKSIFDAWSVMRNFANVIFVIGFLIIIFSQITSIGITNYGIKKLLPRLIAAAILVNLSYWICSIAVDASNILGSSFNSILQNVKNGISVPDPGALGTTGSGWVGIAEYVLASGLAIGIVYLAVAALLPALVTALVAIVTVFVVLTLRQALIILLIVISPLAFVAYLLPNTESWFKKWRELFQALLLMYPIIAILFGASALASKIVMGTASGDYKIAIQIMGALIGILPLVLTPVVMKAASGILSKVAGVVNNPNKGPFDRLRKRAEQTGSNINARREIRGLNRTGTLFPTRHQRAARRSAVSANLESEVKRAQQQYIANAALNNPKLANQLAGGTAFSKADPAALARAIAGAQFTIERAEAEEVKAHHATIDSMNEADLNRVLSDKSSSDTKKAAALERLVAIGSMSSIEKAVNEHGSSGESNVITRSLANALSQNGPPFLKKADIDNIGRGQMGQAVIDPATGAPKIDPATGNVVHVASDMATMASENVEAGVYSEKKMVGASNDELSYASRAATTAGRKKLQTTAKALKANATLKGDIKHNEKAIDSIDLTGVF